MTIIISCIIMMIVFIIIIIITIIIIIIMIIIIVAIMIIWPFAGSWADAAAMWCVAPNACHARFRRARAVPSQRTTAYIVASDKFESVFKSLIRKGRSLILKRNPML